MKIGLQLYSVREALGSDLPGTVRAVKNMGYDYVELAGGRYGLSGGENIPSSAPIRRSSGIPIKGARSGIVPMLITAVPIAAAVRGMRTSCPKAGRSAIAIFAFR